MRLGIPYVGVAFFVWVGIFNLSMIAQFWSFANDIYTKDAGDRLFPLIVRRHDRRRAARLRRRRSALFPRGMTAVGDDADRRRPAAAAPGDVHARLAAAVGGRRPKAEGRAPRRGGFGLVLSNPYLRLIALLVVLLNIVNTTGEYILARLVTGQAAQLAAADPDFDSGAFIGAFNGSYFFWVNVASVLLQAFVVSRLVKRFGMAGALLALPLIALGGYGMAAVGVGFAMVRWIKTAENATDYSIMNTARQMLWLPTTREEKYKAKQAIDTFFVRFGDLLSAAVVFVGTHYFTLSASGFAAVNVVVVVLALIVARLLLAEYHRLVPQTK